MAQAKPKDLPQVQEFDLSIDDVIRKYSNADSYPRYKQALGALVEKCLERVAAAPTAQSCSQVAKLARLGEIPTLKNRVTIILAATLQGPGLPSFKINLINALVKINTTNDKILQNDLIVELNAILQSLDGIHRKNPNTNDLSNLLSAVAFFLDKLVDNHVIQVDKRIILDDIFQGLTTHPDWDVAYLARYCIQAYRTIPASPTEGVWTVRIGAVIGAASALASAAGTIAAAVLTAGATTFIATATVPANLLDAYNKGKDFWNTFGSKDPAVWYMKVRGFQALLNVIKTKNYTPVNYGTVTLSFQTDNFNRDYDPLFLMGILRELDISMVECSFLTSDELIIKTLCHLFDVCRTNNKPWLCGRILLLLLRCRSQTMANKKIIDLLVECADQTVFNYNDHNNVLRTVYKYMINGVLNNVFKDEQINFYFNAFTTATNSWRGNAQLIKDVVLEATLFLSKYGVNEARNSRQVIKRLKEYTKANHTVVDITVIDIDVDDPKDDDPDGSQFVRLAYGDLSIEDKDFLNPIINNVIRRHIFDGFIINETRSYISANAIELDKEYDRENRLSTYLNTIEGGEPGSPLISPTSTDDTLIKQFLQNDSKVLLLLANGGMGKTVFCKKLAMDFGQSLYSKYIEKKTPIPLDETIPVYIHLPAIVDIEKLERLIDHIFINQYNLRPEMIGFLKTNQRFLFILDSYDEMKDTYQNLYRSKKLDEWVRSKFIISCRITPLISRPSYYTAFVPWASTSLGSEKKGYQEFMLTRFDSSKISQYIPKWIGIYQTRVEDEKDKYHVDMWLQPATYEKYISGSSQITGLKTLVQIPLFLIVTMNALPRIVDQSPDKDKISEQNAHSLFRHYAHFWFETEEDKLIRAGKAPKVKDLKGLYWEYAKSLATEMSDRLDSHRIYTVIWPLDTTDPDLSDEERGQREAANKTYAWYFSETPVPEVPVKIRQRFLKLGLTINETETEKDRDIVMIEFRGCPLMQPGPSQFAFIHSEIQFFFHAADVYDNKIKSTDADKERIQRMLNPGKFTKPEST